MKNDFENECWKSAISSYERYKRLYRMATTNNARETILLWLKDIENKYPTVKFSRDF